MFDGIGKSAVGSILDQIGEQTKLADFATAGLLSGITPILEGVAQAQAAQFAPILDAIKGTYFEGFTSTAVTGILASSRDAGLAGFSSGELPAIRSLARDWEGLGLLDFATPVAKPEARKTAEVPTSPEVERYETLSAAESLGIAALQRVEELITGLQVMLHADARNLEKRYAVDDRERRVERRLLVLAIVLPSAIALIQLLKG